METALNRGWFPYHDPDNYDRTISVRCLCGNLHHIDVIPDIIYVSFWRMCDGTILRTLHTPCP